VNSQQQRKKKDVRKKIDTKKIIIFSIVWISTIVTIKKKKVCIDCSTPLIFDLRVAADLDTK